MHPTKYIGRRIAVVGFYANAPHERILFDPVCTPGHLALRIAGDGASVKQDEQMQSALKGRGNVGIRSIYRGRVAAEKVIYGCNEDECLRLSINDGRLIATDAVLMPSQ